MSVRPWLTGDVRNDDRVGNVGAGMAADLGRLRQKDEFVTARRALIPARSHWFSVMLRKFMVAMSRNEVNHDGHGGTAPDPMTWDKGSIIKPRASLLQVIVDHASSPGPLGFLDSSWCSLFHSPIIQEDVAVWPYSVTTLPEFTSFLALFYWPHGAADLGKYGSSYFELLVMFETPPWPLINA